MVRQCFRKKTNYLFLHIIKRIFDLLTDQMLIRLIKIVCGLNDLNSGENKYSSPACLMFTQENDLAQILKCSEETNKQKKLWTQWTWIVCCLFCFVHPRCNTRKRFKSQMSLFFIEAFCVMTHHLNITVGPTRSLKWNKTLRQLINLCLMESPTNAFHSKREKVVLASWTIL